MNKHYTMYTRYNIRKCALNANLYQFNGLDAFDWYRVF